MRMEPAICDGLARMTGDMHVGHEPNDLRRLYREVFRVDQVLQISRHDLRFSFEQQFDRVRHRDGMERLIRDVEHEAWRD